MMPGHLGDIGRAGIKVVTVFPGNHGTPYDSHQGAVLLGEHAGRESAAEITLFESLGLGIEDVAAAEHAYRRGVELGVGTEVSLGETGDG